MRMYRMVHIAAFLVAFFVAKIMRRHERYPLPAAPRSGLPRRPLPAQPKTPQQSEQDRALDSMPGMRDALAQHGMNVCSCGAILAYCACSSCLNHGQERTVVFPNACSICIQRGVSAMLGPVLEVGADQVLIAQGGRVLEVKAFSASVPLANLRAMIAMADASGFSDSTQIGMLVREARALSIPREIDITISPDGASRMAVGVCSLCAKEGLRDGEYCISCALEMREAGDES